MMNFDKIFFIGDNYEFENLFRGVSYHDFESGNAPSVYGLKLTDDKKNLIVLTGFGKANAGAAVQFALDHFRAEEYLNMGLVGSLSDKCNIGDMVMVKECRSYDTDFRAFGYELGQLPKSPIVIYQLRCLKDKIKAIRLVSGDRFVTDKNVLNEIVEIYGPDCVEVELATIAHVFFLNGLLDRLVSVRTVSDKANQNATKDFYKTPEDMFKKTNVWLRSYLGI